MLAVTPSATNAYAMTGNARRRNRLGQKPANVLHATGTPCTSTRESRCAAVLNRLEM
jgi:hypothetical protein